MKTNFTFGKAVKNAFFLLASAAVILCAEISFAGPDSLERYHVSLAEKYGFSDYEVSVTRVTNPDRLKTIKGTREKTLNQLVDFASSIDADAFTYKINNAI